MVPKWTTLSLPPVGEPPPWEAQGEAPEAAVAASAEPAVPLPPTVRPEPVASVPEPAASAPAPVVEASAPAEATPEPTVATATVDGCLDHAGWLARFESLGLGGLTRNLAANCVVENDDGERLRLRLDPALSAMNAEVHVERIGQALAAIGVARRLTIEEGPLPEGIETPRLQAERLAAERHAEAVEALNNDPHVRQLQQVFGARLIESTVKPADAEARG